MIKLTNSDSGLDIYIDKDHIGAIVELPKTDKFPARTRIDGKGSFFHICYLVKEDAATIRQSMKK